VGSLGVIKRVLLVFNVVVVIIVHHVERLRMVCHAVLGEEVLAYLRLHSLIPEPFV
jgi:hypothetical protein